MSHAARLCLAPTAVLSLLLAAAPVAAGVVITMESKPPGAAAPETMTVSLLPDRMRVDTASASVVFRADRQVLWVLQPAEKSYVELTAAQAEKMSAMLSEVQAQLAALPPEQRAMVEQMVRQQAGGALPPGALGGASPPPIPVTFRSTGKTETINGWACSSYDAMRGEKREEELWVTPFAGVALTEADFAACAALAEFLKKLVGPMATQLDASPFAKRFGEGPDAVPGVPVRIVHHGADGTSTHEIKKVERADVPASSFEPPAGYRKETLEGM